MRASASAALKVFSIGMVVFPLVAGVLA
jgi:hypothetical protein